MSDPGISIDERVAARLLELGQLPPRRSADLLLEELQMGGSHRIESLLAGSPVGARGADLLAGRLDLGDLVALKDACLEGPGHASVRDHLERLAGYLACVAAALRHHGRLVCNQDTERVHDVLVDLALVTPEAWSELFFLAAERLGRQIESPP